MCTRCFCVVAYHPHDWVHPIMLTYTLLQVKQLISDLNDLAYDIEGLLKNHLSLFNIKSSEDVKRLEDFVQ